MNNFQDLWSWFITSSADPKNTSLAVKGTLMLFSGYVLQAIQIACAVGLACLPIDNDTVTNIINALSTLLEGGLMIVGAVSFFIGLLRKYNLGRWTALQTPQK